MCYAIFRIVFLAVILNSLTAHAFSAKVAKNAQQLALFDEFYSNKKGIHLTYFYFLLF